MEKKSINFNYIVLLSLFILCYFYLDYSGIEKLVSLLLLGITLSIAAFILYSKKITVLVKAVLLVILVLLIYFLPAILLEKKKSNTNNQKVVGGWVTDTTGGFSIKFEIEKDSAYLSQSNLEIVRDFKIVITNDTLILENEELKTEYVWAFQLSSDYSELLLFNKRDSLKFKRFK